MPTQEDLFDLWWLNILTDVCLKWILIGPSQWLSRSRNSSWDAVKFRFTPVTWGHLTIGVIDPSVTFIFDIFISRSHSYSSITEMMWLKIQPVTSLEDGLSLESDMEAVEWIGTCIGSELFRWMKLWLDKKWCPMSDYFWKLLAEFGLGYSKL